MRDDFLIKRDIAGNKIGIDLHAIKPWVVDQVPFHSDLEPYVLVHSRTKTLYLSALADHLTTSQVIRWTHQVQAATAYLDRLVDAILEQDETSYNCDLRTHKAGEICPNRIGLRLPNP